MLRGPIEEPTPPLVALSPTGRIDRVIVSIRETGSSGRSASKASRTITGVSLPTVDGKATDCTTPPGPFAVTTRQRTRYPVRPATATGSALSTWWDVMPPWVRRPRTSSS